VCAAARCRDELASQESLSCCRGHPRFRAELEQRISASGRLGLPNRREHRGRRAGAAQLCGGDPAVIEAIRVPGARGSRVRWATLVEAAEKCFAKSAVSDPQVRPETMLRGKKGRIPSQDRPVEYTTREEFLRRRRMGCSRTGLVKARRKRPDSPRPRLRPAMPKGIPPSRRAGPGTVAERPRRSSARGGGANKGICPLLRLDVGKISAVWSAGSEEHIAPR